MRHHTMTHRTHHGRWAGATQALRNNLRRPRVSQNEKPHPKKCCVVRTHVAHVRHSKQLRKTRKKHKITLISTRFTIGRAANHKK